MGKIMIACVIILIVFAAMLASRSQALQRFAVLELALVLAVSGSACLGYLQSESFAEEQFLDMYGLYAGRLSTYLQQLEEQGADADIDKTRLGELLDQALPLTTSGGESYTYLGAAVVTRGSSGVTYRAAASLGDHARVFEDYRDQAQALLLDCLRNQKVSSGVTPEHTGLLALVDTTQIAPETGLVVEVSLEPLEGSLESFKEDAVRSGVLLLGAGTLLLALIIYLQGREIRRAVRMITRVAEGKGQWEAESAKKGRIGESNEMRALRNSLTQLMSDNYRTNYMKYRMLQAYYRFAPKQIEKILNKPSILDVDKTDHIQMNGTLAFVSASISEGMEQQEALKRLNENYEVIGDARNAKEGVFLSGNSDLSTLNFLFAGDAGAALQFGIDAVTRREDARAKGQTFVLLHHTRLVYGVAGDDRQASTYVLSREMKVLELYTDKLRGMGIRMAVTDSVYGLIGGEVQARYIGFVEKGKYCFKLYEILDAYPAKERQRRLDTTQKFRDAMNLFYQDDFYLARNLFTEVLKENPTDEVAKWYLFLCEKCLNSGQTGDISYGLFSEDQQ